jgi:hypothetical protein
MIGRDLIFRNFWLKLFSIASGTVIWMAIHYSIAHDVTLEEPAPGVGLVKRDILVPVMIMAQNHDSFLRSISNTDTNRPYNVTPSEVMLTVFGPPGILNGKDVEKIKVFVDLTDFHSKTPAREDLHADVPQDVYVHEIKPATVTVQPLNQQP